ISQTRADAVAGRARPRARTYRPRARKFRDNRQARAADRRRQHDHGRSRPRRGAAISRFPAYARMAQGRAAAGRMVAPAAAAAVLRRHAAAWLHADLTVCLSMIFSENRYPLFGIMLYGPT